MVLIDIGTVHDGVLQVKVLLIFDYVVSRLKNTEFTIKIRSIRVYNEHYNSDDANVELFLIRTVHKSKRTTVV